MRSESRHERAVREATGGLDGTVADLRSDSREFGDRTLVRAHVTGLDERAVDSLLGGVSLVVEGKEWLVRVETMGAGSHWEFRSRPLSTGDDPVTHID